MSNSSAVCRSAQVQQPDTKPGKSCPPAGSGSTDTADVQWRASGTNHQPELSWTSQKLFKVQTTPTVCLQTLLARLTPSVVTSKSNPVWRILVPAAAAQPIPTSKPTLPDFSFCIGGCQSPSWWDWLFARWACVNWCVDGSGSTYNCMEAKKEARTGCYDCIPAAQAIQL